MESIAKNFESLKKRDLSDVSKISEELKNSKKPLLLQERKKPLLLFSI